MYVPSSSLLQGKYRPFSPSPLRLNMFRLFVILSLTKLYRYTPEIFLFRLPHLNIPTGPPIRQIEQEYSANVAWSVFITLFYDFLRLSPLKKCEIRLYYITTIFLSVGLMIGWSINFCLPLLRKGLSEYQKFVFF
jgi:hypothetical protein